MNHLINNADHCCTNSTDVLTILMYRTITPLVMSETQSSWDSHLGKPPGRGDWGDPSYKPRHVPGSHTFWLESRTGKARAASSASRPPWNRASKQVRATAMELPLDITIIPDSRRSPEKRDRKPHKLSPPSPCSPSLIKIERTHVPISHLLEGCCGVYASSLYTGTKFEYHLHLSGRQWILHQTPWHGPLPPPRQGTERGGPDDISWEQALSPVCFLIYLIRPLPVTEAHPSWRGILRGF